MECMTPKDYCFAIASAGLKIAAAFAVVIAATVLLCCSALGWLFTLPTRWADETHR